MAVSDSSQFQCGHWAVLRVSMLLGTQVAPDTILQLLPHSDNGHTLAELRAAFATIGFDSVGRYEGLDRLTLGDYPCVIHLKEPDHYITVYKSAGDVLYCFDGSGQRKRLNINELSSRWSGNVLRVSPNKVSPLPRHAFRSSIEAQLNDPRAKFDTLYSDAGDVPIGQPTVKYKFLVTNVGSAPLLILRMHTGCSCLTATNTTAPILPGETGRLDIEYHVTGKLGVFKHDIVVETNDPIYPLYTLIATGNTDTRVAYEPKSINFGDVATGSTRSTHVFLRYYGDDPSLFQLTDVACSLPGSSARVIDHRELPATRNQIVTFDNTRSDIHVKIIEISWNPSFDLLSTDYVNGWLTFQIPSLHLEKQRIPIGGCPKLPFSMDCTSLNFGVVHQTDGHMSASMLFSSSLGRNFRIIRATADDATAVISYPTNMSDRVVVKLSCSAEAALSMHRSTLRLVFQFDNSDGPIEFDFKLPIYAWPPVP